MEEPKKDLTIRRNDNSVVGMIPEDAEGVYKISTFLAQSDLCPKSFGNKPSNVFACIMLGRELGIGAMSAMANIAVVNGRASLWGELVVGLIRSSGLCQKLVKKVEGSGKTLSVTVIGQRKGDTTDTIETFTWADAENAGLASKETYQKYPKDMLYWKAMNRIGKFLWPDVLKGLNIREVAEEMATEFVGQVEILDAKIPAAPAPEELTPEQLKAKADAAVAKKSKLEAKEAAKAEKKAAKSAKPSPAAEALKEIPEAQPEEKAAEPVAPTDSKEESLEEPATAEAEVMNRCFGTLITAIKLSDPATGTAMGFALKMGTKDGEEKFTVESLEKAMEAKKFTGKTLEFFWKALETPIVGVKGRIIKYNPINPA